MDGMDSFNHQYGERMMYAVKTTNLLNDTTRYTKASSLEDAIFKKGIENSIMKDSWDDNEFTVEIIEVNNDFDFENQSDF